MHFSTFTLIKNAISHFAEKTSHTIWHFHNFVLYNTNMNSKYRQIAEFTGLNVHRTFFKLYQMEEI